MNCSRCNAEAVVKRGSAAYCAKCALARDWEDVIAIVQEDRVEMDRVPEVELKGDEKATKAKKAPAEDPAKEPASVAADSNGSGGDELPADPFA